MNKKEFQIPENFYFHGDEVSQFTYVQVPLALIREKVFADISDTAKLLYGLMLNRAGLSLRNGWNDENDRTYIIYSVENVQEDFGIGHTKASNLFAELSDINGTGVGLIKKERVLNKPSRIYVMNFMAVYEYLTGTFGQLGQTLGENASEPAEIQVVRECGRRSSVNADDGQPQMRTTDNRKRGRRTSVNADDGQPQTRTTDNRECGQRSSANTDENYQDMSYQEMRNHYPINQGGDKLMDEMDEVRELIRENVEYDALCEDYSDYEIKRLDELIEIMVEACVLEGDMEIKGRLIPHQTIRSRFEKYDSATMMYVMQSLAENTTEVKNVKKYLLATLFNAPLTQGNQMNLSVQHDLYGKKE